MVQRVAWLTTDLGVAEGRVIPGGCAYYRCYLPMRSIGIEDQIIGKPAWTGEHGFGVRLPGKFARFGYDVIVLKLLFDRSLAHQMRVARSLGQKVVVDVDDYLDEVDPRNVSSRVLTEQRLDSFRAAAREADRIIVSTQELFDVYSRFHGDVRIIRNGIDASKYPIHAQGNTPIVGWVGAIPWRSGDIETLREWLPDMCEDGLIGGIVHLGHIPGERTFAEAAGIEPTFVRTLPMVPLTRYPQALAASGMDIGLVLLTDIPFNRAKSFLKGMEYAAAGIIPVAQGLPEYQRLAETGVGRVAHTAEDWTAQLEILVKMGRRARTRLARADRRNLISAHDMSQREQAWKAAITDW